jgi:hypothetical protein
VRTFEAFGAGRCIADATDALEQRSPGKHFDRLRYFSYTHFDPPKPSTESIRLSDRQRSFP